MNIVEIEVTGPFMENMARVDVQDQYEGDSFHLDYTDVERARDEGSPALLELILENSGSKIYGILSAASTNESPVSLDGDVVEVEQLKSLLRAPAP